MHIPVIRNPKEKPENGFYYMPGCINSLMPIRRSVVRVFTSPCYPCSHNLHKHSLFASVCTIGLG